jgi:hypothetical protein
VRRVGPTTPMGMHSTCMRDDVASRPFSGIRPTRGKRANVPECSHPQVVFYVDNIEWLRSTDNEIQVSIPGPPGFHTLFVSLAVKEIERDLVVNRMGQGQRLVAASANFLVIDPNPHSLTNMTCAADLLSAGGQLAGVREGAGGTDGSSEGETDQGHTTGGTSPVTSRAGFGGDKWQHMRACLNAFLAVHPRCAGAHLELASLDAAHGLWRAAVERYTRVLEHAAVTASDPRGNPASQQASTDSWSPNAAPSSPHTSAAELITAQQRLTEVAVLLEEEEQRWLRGGHCTWHAYTGCSGPPETQTCKARNATTLEAGVAAVLAPATEPDLFLSIVMVGRHDSTQFCQAPADACLDRMRVSLSVLFALLVKHGLSAATELLLVEYNPCYANSKAEEGSCDPRSDGYLSLEQVVRELVEPPPASPVTVRVLYVSEEVHDLLYNPYYFDLMEFVGKNVAARRARGRFLLFANPDDVWSDALVRRLADQHLGLRDDVVYATFRGTVNDHVPVARGASARSFARFVEGNSESTEDKPLSVAHVAGRWRRAACRAGESEEEPMRTDTYGYLHDSAAGDFLLMSRRIVHAIRGYPEIPTNIMIDGTAIHAAAAHGFGQLIFAGECVIFHQPHPRSYNTKGSMISLQTYEALAQQLLDAKTNANVRPDAQDTAPTPQSDAHRPDKRPEESLDWSRYNDANWGLALVDIPQVILSPVCSQ